MEGEMMMTNCMDGSGWMMVGMGLFWLLAVALMALAAAALVKYLRAK